MIKDYVKASFSELFNRKLNYCLLRNFQGLPERIGNDIDILVDPKHLNEISQVFLKNAKKNGFHFIKRIERDGYLGLYFSETVSNEILLIDLFYKLQKRWKHYANIQQLLSNKVKYKQFYVLNPTHEVYTITMKEILTYGFVRDKYIKRFNEIKLNQKLFNAISNQFLKENDRIILFESIKTKKIFNSENDNYMRLKNPTFLRLMYNIMSYTKCFLKSKIKNLFGPSPIVCLIGPDGVGKSTLSEVLKAASLKSNLYNDAKIYHHRFDLIPALGKLFAKRNNKAKEINPDYGHINTIHTWSRTMIYLIYYSFDFILGWTVVFNAKLKNEIIIFDRYYFDFFIQNSYSAVSNNTKRFFYLFLPKPNATFFLYANPYTVVARKNELTIEQHLKQNNQCLYILKHVVKNPIFLNCNGSVSQNKNLIVSKFLSKFKIQ